MWSSLSKYIPLDGCDNLLSPGLSTFISLPPAHPPVSKGAFNNVRLFLKSYPWVFILHAIMPLTTALRVNNNKLQWILEALMRSVIYCSKCKRLPLPPPPPPHGMDPENSVPSFPPPENWVRNPTLCETQMMEALLKIFFFSIQNSA